MNVAVDSPKGIENMSKRIGLRASSGQPLSALKDRLLVVRVKDRDPQRLSTFLLGLAKLIRPARPLGRPSAPTAAPRPFPRSPSS